MPFFYFLHGREPPHGLPIPKSAAMSIHVRADHAIEENIWNECGPVRVIIAWCTVYSNYNFIGARKLQFILKWSSENNCNLQELHINITVMYVKSAHVHLIPTHKTNSIYTNSCYITTFLYRAFHILLPLPDICVGIFMYCLYRHLVWKWRHVSFFILSKLKVKVYRSKATHQKTKMRGASTLILNIIERCSVVSTRSLSKYNKICVSRPHHTRKK